MEDLPQDLAVAITHALVVSSWHEHLPREEIPPMWMWPLPWEVELWFERVENERKKKYNIKDDNEVAEPAMERNIYAEGLR